MESQHQSFEHWITTEEPLGAEQAAQLRLHLETCEQCRQFETAWHTVQHTLQAAPLANPAPGFTTRWQTRQAAEQQMRRKRQTRLFLAYSVSMAALLFAIMAVQVFGLLRDPETLGMIWLVRIFSVLSFAETSREFLLALFTSLAKVPLPVYVLLVGFVSLLCVIWATVIQQLRRLPNTSGG